MPDINPIQGPIGPKEDPQKRDQKKIGTPEKFKEQYRVQEVDKTDADAKKNRKRREEQVDDDTVEGAAIPTNPIKGGSLDASPFEVQAPGKKGVTPTSNEKATPAVPYDKSYAPSPSFTDLGDEGDDDDFSANLPSGPVNSSAASTTQQPLSTDPTQNQNQGLSFSENDFTTQQPTTNQQNTQNTPSQNTYQQNSPSTSQNTPSSSNSTPPNPVVKTLASKDAKTDSKTSAPALSEKGKAAASSDSSKSSGIKDKQETTPSHAASVKDPQDPQASSKPVSPTEAPPPPPPRNKELTPEEAGLSWDDELPPVSALSSEHTSGGKDGEKKDEDDTTAQSQMITPDTPAPFSIDAATATQGALPTYTTFSPAMLDMFEKMVGTISVLQASSGERKTTITLTSPNFASSVFYGAEVVIEEDLNLAPGQYNIRLTGSPEAVSLFQAKSDDLLAAFQSGNYNFKVQRLETSIQSADKPLFKRKEKAGGESSSDEGKGNNS